MRRFILNPLHPAARLLGYNDDAQLAGARASRSALRRKSRGKGKQQLVGVAAAAAGVEGAVEEPTVVVAPPQKSAPNTGREGVPEWMLAVGPESDSD